MARLGDVCTINPKSPGFQDELTVSFVPMPKVGENGEFDPSEVKKYLEVKKGFTYFQDNDVLFAKITPCMENGKGAIAQSLENGIGFGSTEFHVLRPLSEYVTSKWLFYLLSWPAFRKEAEKNMTGSAGQKRVPKSFLEKYTVNIPDLCTQVKMTDTLDKICSLISLRKQQLAKLDELVKARFVEMFGDIHGSKQYPYKPVYEITSVISGGTPSRGTPEYWDEGNIPWVKTTELQNSRITTVDECITKAGLDNSAAKIVPVGTILIAMYGQGKTRGMTAYLDIEASTNQACACILPSDVINQIYLWQYFVFSYDKLRNMAKGGNQPNLNSDIVKAFPVLTPPISLQLDFATFFEQVDRKKLTIQQSLDKLEVLKKSLMQEYFG